MARKKEIFLGRTTLRLNHDGTVDELLLKDAAGNVILHMEELNNDLYWLKVYAEQTDGQNEMVLTFSSKRTISVRHEVEPIN